MAALAGGHFCFSTASRCQLAWAQWITGLLSFAQCGGQDHDGKLEATHAHVNQGCVVRAGLGCGGGLWS